MIPHNFDSFGGGYSADDVHNEPESHPARSTTPTMPSIPSIPARVQASVAVSQERIANHLAELAAQSEPGARARRQQERRERAEQQLQMVDALRTLTVTAHAMAETNARMREQAEALHAEIRTLRSTILPAHSIGSEVGGLSSLDVAGGTAEPFAIPQQPEQPASSSSAPSSSNRAAPAKAKPKSKLAKAKRTRNLSPEARERISAAQKARWAAQRARDE